MVGMLAHRVRVPSLRNRHVSQRVRNNPRPDACGVLSQKTYPVVYKSIGGMAVPQNANFKTGKTGNLHHAKSSISEN